MEAGRPRSAPRVLAVDVLRGLVLFFLLPDLTGGFSFYKVAEALPESPVWQALAAQFRHVDWTGVAVWDLVMPLFVFMVGVSMALSYANRRRAGQTEHALLRHAAVRSAALLLLGLLLQFQPVTRWDELLPFFVLSTGLPVASGLVRLIRPGLVDDDRMDAVYAVLVLAVVGGWVVTHHEQLGHYEIGSQILALLGLAYFPAYLLQRLSLRAQMAAIAIVIASYGLAFSAYAAWMAAGGTWAPGQNLGAALDHWFFPQLPRAESYRGNAHDYHSLLFVPLIAAIAFGALVGKVIDQRGATKALALRFGLIAMAGLLLSGVMSLEVAPLLKSLWTPTWSVFSSSMCLLLLSALMLVFQEGRYGGLASPLVVLGTNSMLLYVLAFTQRWRIVGLFDKLTGTAMPFTLPWRPLIESCVVLACLWAIAYVLHRARIFVRL